ncbi:MAG: hypothetical protein EOP83_16975 [Verrucomicrobiaceae bacterium]|nr:MAG: hypothetical protein EOP83_16975 [Verrucomicrobiaceae bacterium]
MIVNELFDSNAKLTWVVSNNSRMEAHFTLEEIPFRLVFDNETQDPENEPAHWDVFFAVSQAYATEKQISICGNTGVSRNTAVKVLSVVVNGIEGFLQKKRPDVLSFVGSDVLGKGALYVRMAKALQGRASAIGYTTTYEQGDGELVFSVKQVSTNAA